MNSRVTRLLSLPLLALVVGLSLLVATDAAQADTAVLHSFSGAKGNQLVSARVTNGKQITLVTHHKNLNKGLRTVSLAVRKPHQHTWIYANAIIRPHKQVLFNKRGSFHSYHCRGAREKENLAKNTVRLWIPRRCVGSPKGKIGVNVTVLYGKSGTSSAPIDTEWKYIKR